jgi:hypothetical protein
MSRTSAFRHAIAVLTLVSLLLSGVPATTGQEGGTVTLEFVSYEGNPIIARGAEGEWDAFVGSPRVVYHDGLFHMFYLGSSQEYTIAVTHVGYATSQDGLNWTKYEGNPILSLDPSVAANGTGPVVPYVDEGTWVMLVNQRWRPGGEGGFAVQRATAPNPTGPWKIEETILFERGSGRDWDQSSIAIHSIVHAADAYHIYYDSSPNLGLITSPDGLTWTKYDDPETDSATFRNNDPVLGPGERGRWDDGFVNSVTVWLGNEGWEMIYFAGPSGQLNDGSRLGFGYATSEDGITWTRHSDAPFFTLGPDFVPFAPNLIVVDDVYYLYHNIVPWDSAEIEIGVAVGTITRN